MLDNFVVEFLSAQLAGIIYSLGAGLSAGVKESGGFLGAGRGLGSTIAGAGAMLAVASRGTDFRRRISILRHCGSSPGAPRMASVSSVFTSCAPESGINL